MSKSELRRRMLLADPDTTEMTFSASATDEDEAEQDEDAAQAEGQA